MTRARLSRHPHHSWLLFPVAARAKPSAVHLRSVSHSLSLTLRGDHHVCWINHGREARWTESGGTLHFLPADHDDHTFVTTTTAQFRLLVLFIPSGHLHDLAAEDGAQGGVEFERLLLRGDAVLEACLARLASPAAASSPDHRDGSRDAAARRLVLRLLELNGGGPPDWRDDESVFTPHTLCHLVEFIDAHLSIAPGLADLGRLVGLAPSHFGKKFRQSTGLSLHRFVNRRRLQASLGMLRDSAAPLARVACDLGFSSQSHFTRLFSELIGITPARYRKLCKATVG